ncbi:MAG: SRPBCC domain-containing protein [Pseudomonadota bacterium]
MKTGVNVCERADECDLVFTREFSAPVEAVYEAWTQPELLKEWWGPYGFSMTINEMSIAIGGIWDYVLHGPDGVSYPNRAVFEEVLPMQRLVIRNTGGHSVSQHLTCRMIVEFKGHGPSTVVTLTMRFATSAALGRARVMGAEQGGVESFERLAKQVGGKKL